MGLGARADFDGPANRFANWLHRSPSQSIDEEPDEDLLARIRSA